VILVAESTKITWSFVPSFSMEMRCKTEVLCSKYRYGFEIFCSYELVKNPKWRPVAYETLLLKTYQNADDKQRKLYPMGILITYHW